jgi:O-acetyl-ADP-ribose deacetylase (regulator of RNase III)
VASTSGDDVMSEGNAAQGIRFGRTVIDAVVGELVDQPVQAIIYPANTRGVIGAGPASSVRFAGGPEIERETMELAPLDLGDAVATTAGRLQERGIEAILHAVIVPGLGDSPRPTVVRRALEAALALATESRLRTVGLPLLGVNAEAPLEERSETVSSLVEIVVKYVRRPGSRIDRVIFVSRFEDDLAVLSEAITRARSRWWTSPA